MARWPGQLTLEAVQESFRQVWQELLPFLAGTPNLNGRRFTNAGNAVEARDFLTLGQGDDRYEKKKLDEITGIPKPEKKFVRIDIYANRGAAWLFPNTYFEASDRNYVAWASDGVNWIYAYGIQQRTQAQLSALAATLGTSDAGYLADVTDFGWKLRWSGSAWGFGPGQTGGGYIQGFTAAPLAGTWQICDGTATTYLKGDGTTGNFTTPNLSGHYLKFAGAYTGTAIAGGTTSFGSGSTTVDHTLAGATIVVASSDHTHGPGNLDLVRTELIPYFRR